MKTKKYITTVMLGIIAVLFLDSCTKLDQEVYSVVSEENFWRTPDQIASGISPGYQALSGLPGLGSSLMYLNEVTSDELIVPTRGGDWFDGGVPQDMWKHTWNTTTNHINGAWESLFNGIGRVNFALNSIDNLKEKPADIEATIAELKILRAYYYFWALDLYRNVPLVIDFNTNPDDVSNSSGKEVFDFLVLEIQNNINLLSEDVDITTYGRFNKWAGYALLAKLYMNAEVFIGEEHWAEARDALDMIINSGNYSLNPSYFDNFSPNNGPDSPENILVVPFDKVNIKGNNWQNFTLHYQNQENFGLTESPYNGWSAEANFYSKFDTVSSYRIEGPRKYRTFRDQRSGQWLYGQQFSLLYNYPPDKDVLVEAEEALKLKDASTGLDLFLNPEMNTISSSSNNFRLAGVRNIKYFPEQGTGGGEMSNDMVLFRYADVLLMKAEAEMRLNNFSDVALDPVNLVRTRAYSGDTDFNWSLSDLTLKNLLDERARELAWEMWRRQDLIRFEVADGFPYFSGARIPDKDADPDSHTLIFPIPANQRSANPNLNQNPGY